MESKIKKNALPILVILLAIVGAFASNLSKQDNANLLDRQGYIRVGIVCTPTTIICSAAGGSLCNNGVDILYDWNGTSCPVQLYKKP